MKNGGRYAPKTGHNPSQLCLEDPLNQANNVAGNSFGALQVKTAFEFAFVTLARAVSPNRNDLGNSSADTRWVVYLNRLLTILKNILLIFSVFWGVSFV